MKSPDEFCRLATKYGLCQDQLPEGVPTIKELKERFEMFEWCKDKASAAAFGYYAALEELKGDGEEKEISVFDSICATIEQAQDCELSSEEAVEIIMGLMYKWTKEVLNKQWDDTPFIGYNTAISLLNKAFSIYVKPGVIS